MHWWARFINWLDFQPKQQIPFLPVISKDYNWGVTYKLPDEVVGDTLISELPSPKAPRKSSKPKTAKKATTPAAPSRKPLKSAPKKPQSQLKSRSKKTAK